MCVCVCVIVFVFIELQYSAASITTCFLFLICVYRTDSFVYMHISLLYLDLLASFLLACLHVCMVCVCNRPDVFMQLPTCKQGTITANTENT